MPLPDFCYFATQVIEISIKREKRVLIRRSFDLTTYFSFQVTIHNSESAIFQGGLIRCYIFFL